MIRKGLVIGIIILFIGASFTPNILGLQLNFKSNDESRNRVIINVDSDDDFEGDTPNLISVSIIQKMYALRNAITSPPMYVYVALDAPGFYDWDVNMDWVIDIIDLTLVSNAYNSTGPPGWIREDVNDDGIVDINDLIIIMDHYGETYTPIYNKIQDGIDAVAKNGTVYVYNGTYYENVIVNKTVNLTGEDKNITVIDGGGIGDVVYVSANYVNINGFTIQNSGDIHGPDYDTGIDIRSNHNIIINNNISNNNQHGIVLYYSSDNLIFNNIINSNYNRGIFAFYSNFNNITKNNIGFCSVAIKFYESSYNNITRNLISNNYFGFEIYHSCNNNIFSNNDIISNTGEGISCSYSENNMFINNTLSSNDFNGIRFHGSSYNNVISGNTISSNNRNGIELWKNCHENLIFDNNLCSNKENGIKIHSTSHVNLIYHNNLINNTNNAYDECINTWDNGYPSGGNYWDDYPYDDEKHGPNQDLPGHDRIGDIPYDLPCEHATDYFPVMHPYGWLNKAPENLTIDGPSTGKAGQSYTYTTSSDDPEIDPIYYKFYWGDGNLSDWVGPYPSGETGLESYSWEEVGDYDIRVKAKDVRGLESEWSDPFQITIPRNKLLTNTLILQLLDKYPLFQKLIQNIGL
jgi:parallel beta-helix repeat protein